MFWIIFDIIINTEITDSQLPWSDWIRAHRSSISGLNSRLILKLYCRVVQYRHLLAPRQKAKMVFGVWRIFNVGDIREGAKSDRGGSLSIEMRI